MSEILEKIKELTIAGQGPELGQLIQRALADQREAGEILSQGLIPGMDEVGRRMKSGDMFIPEVLLSARTMQGGLDLLKPHLSEGRRHPGRDDHHRHGPGRPARHR